MKNKYMKEINFREIFNKLKTGSVTDINDAKKDIEKIWKNDIKLFRKSFHFVQEIISDFDNITNPINKVAVISGLKMFYLALADDHFIELKNFILKNLQDKDGRIREVARKIGDWLYISLCDRVDPYPRKHKKDILDQVKRDAVKQYNELMVEIDDLLRVHNIDDDHEYIEDMKPSVQKSLEMFRARLDNPFIFQIVANESKPVSFDILMKRKEIENELEQKLQEIKSDYTVIEIKAMIYEEDSVETLNDLFMIFDDGSINDISTTLEMLNDAWNYFPHRLLGGDCPQEMIDKKQGFRGLDFMN